MSYSKKWHRLWKIFPIVAAVAVTGVLAIRFSGAAGYIVPSEAETGVITGNAKTINSPGASGSGNNAVAFGTDSTGTGGSETPLGLTGNWNMIFQDEFSQPLDWNKWMPCQSSGWLKGSRQGQGCENWGSAGIYTKDNLVVRDGILNLEARKSGNGWTSGAISTAEDSAGISPATYKPFTYTYGYLEVRTKAVPGSGFWSAVWQMPNGGGGIMEMDLMEVNGVLPETDPNNFGMTLHCDFSDRPVDDATKYNQPLSIYSSFHVLGMDWTPTYIDWYVDGKKVKRIEKSICPKFPDRPEFFIANLSVGQEQFNLFPSASQQFPVSMQLDYVRIWQRK